MQSSLKISATIITFNEQKKIEACIKSLLGVADEILVVDSYSTDNTEAICSAYPVRFIKNQFKGYVAQKNFAVEQASFDYILALDADERLSEELRASILEVKGNQNVAEGYVVKRYNNYCGKWMHYSVWYPERKIRLWDKRKVRWSGTDPHDSVRMAKGSTVTLNGNLLHYVYLSVDEHLNQVHRFSEIAARAKFENKEGVGFVFNVLISPLFRFIKTYFLQLGFLDGYYGFVFCSLTASMTYFKYMRLYEYKRKGLPENQKVFLD